MKTEAAFEILKGKDIMRVEEGDENLLFISVTKDYGLLIRHEQQCCERVYLDRYDIEDLQSLVGQTIESISIHESEFPPKSMDFVSSCSLPDYHDSEAGFDFLRINTRDDGATIAFYGESNGYYTTVPDMYLVTPWEHEKLEGWVD